MKPMARRLEPGPFGPLAAPAVAGRTRLDAGRAGIASGSGAGYESRTPTAFSAPEDRSS